MYPNAYPNNQQGPPTGYPAPVPGFAPPQLPFQQPGFPPQQVQPVPTPYGPVPVPGFAQPPASAPPLLHSASPIIPSPSNVGYPPLGTPTPQIGFGNPTPQSVTTMVTYQEIPTLREAHFDPNHDAKVLRRAMKGLGTDEAALINVLARRTNNQRLQIADAYKSSLGRDLVKDLKSETSGKFEDVLVNLMTPRFDYIAQRLHYAMAGIGTKESILIDVLCTSSNQELQWIQAAYHRIYQKPLEKDIKGDTSGHFRRILVSLCDARRSEDIRVDPSAVTQDANALYSAGIKKWGTDESVFNQIISTRSYQHLREVFNAYERVSGQDIESTIKSEFSGDIKDALNAVVRCVKNRAAYFAKRLHDAMDGVGTNDGLLIFLIVTRAEIDLENIKQEYNRLYHKSLAQDIKSDTSGDYKKILLTLAGA